MKETEFPCMCKRSERGWRVREEGMKGTKAREKNKE